MYYHEVREALKVGEKFEPLAFTFTDGTVEIIRHPEYTLPTGGTLAIAKQEPGEETPWLKLYSLSQLLSIEPASRRAN